MALHYATSTILGRGRKRSGLLLSSSNLCQHQVSTLHSIRETIGGLGNLMFLKAYVWAQMRDGKIPDQYVQSHKYWDKYKDEIKTMFGSGIGRMEHIALHIRRGDYLKVSQFHTNLFETGYYQKALKLFPPNEKYIVFYKDRQNPEQDRDDREWCLNNLSLLIGPYGERWQFCPDEQSETDDLNMMASCVGLIGANSSFSWWAAFLNSNPDKKIVFPAKWFVDDIQRTELLPEWELI